MEATGGQQDPTRTEPPQAGSHPTLESAIGAVAGADPQQFYQDGQRFETTAQRLRTLNDGFRRELRRLEDAWQGPGAHQFFGVAQQIMGTVDHLVETLTAPSYSVMHDQLGDAVSEVKRRLLEVQRQRESGRQSLANDPARNSNPQAHQELQRQEQAQNAHAQQMLEQLANVYRQIGGQLKPFPEVGANGNQVRTALYQSSGQGWNGSNAGDAGPGAAMVTTFVAYGTSGAHGGDSGTGWGKWAEHAGSGGALGHDANGAADSNSGGGSGQYTPSATNEGVGSVGVGAAGGVVLAGSGVLGRDSSDSRTGHSSTESSDEVEESLAATGVPGVLSAVGISGGSFARGRNRDREGRVEEQPEPADQEDARNPAVPASTVSTQPGTTGQTGVPTTAGGSAVRTAPTSTVPGTHHGAPVAARTTMDAISPPPQAVTNLSASPQWSETTGVSTANGVPTGAGGTTVSNAPGAASLSNPGQLADTASTPSPPTAEATTRPSAPASGPSTDPATSPGGSPMGGVPPTGGAGAGDQNNRERDRNTFQHEDGDVWDETGFSGGVLGR